jgi:hypothetical protein
MGILQKYSLFVNKERARSFDEPVNYTQIPVRR